MLRAAVLPFHKNPSKRVESSRFPDCTSARHLVYKMAGVVVNCFSAFVVHLASQGQKMEVGLLANRAPHQSGRQAIDCHWSCQFLDKGLSPRIDRRT